MGRDAVQDYFGLGKSLLDLLGGLKSFVRLEHVIGRLSAGSAGFSSVIEELGEILGAVLRAFDAGMKDSLSHRR